MALLATSEKDAERVEADAWAEYRDTVTRAPVENYDELERWAWRRLVETLRSVGKVPGRG